MPFTFSHPAIVLPLTYLSNKWISVTGLVIVYAVYKLPTIKTNKKNLNIKYWTIFTGLTLTVIAIKLLSGLELKQYGNAIVTVISTVLLSLVLTPLILNKKIAATFERFWRSRESRPK